MKASKEIKNILSSRERFGW